jgi:glyoxylase-like metal-dependent hydrolase (beta-lactamase superfamily II)
LIWGVTAIVCLLVATVCFYIFRIRAGEASLDHQQDFSAAEINATHVAGNIYMLEGAGGGNIGLSIGADGALLVDDQFAPLADKVREAIGKLDEHRLRYVLNTHWHGDHTWGNEQFGPDATIVAHANVRKRLSGEWKPVGRKPAPPVLKEALPVITFDQSLSIFFNGEEIRMVHLPNGHTDGDSVVIFTRSNVVHMGDQFSNGKFPDVDLGGGGDFEGLARNLEAVIAQIPADAKIIPGHGPLANVTDLKNYHQLLVETIAIVRERMEAGESLKQIKDMGLPDRWKSWEKEPGQVRKWIQAIYQSLSNHNRP